MGGLANNGITKRLVLYRPPYFLKGNKMFFKKRNKIKEKIVRQLIDVEQWNKRTFRDATLGGQLEKLEEELKEFQEAKGKEEATKELADVFIVLGGLIRWNSRVGIFFENVYFDTLKTKSLEALSEAIDAKMEINRKRKWHKTGNGKFHH